MPSLIEIGIEIKKIGDKKLYNHYFAIISLCVALHWKWKRLNMKYFQAGHKTIYNQSSIVYTRVYFTEEFGEIGSIEKKMIMKMDSMPFT